MGFPIRQSSDLALRSRLIRVMAFGFLFLWSIPGEWGRADEFSCRDLLVRAREFLGGKPVPRKFPVRVVSAFSELVDSRGVGDPEVVRLFVRNAKQSVVNPNYLQNSIDALHEVFSPWFEGLDARSFEAMLRLQHSTLTQGIDRQHLYRSTSELQPLEKSGMGRFRSENVLTGPRPAVQLAVTEFQFELSSSFGIPLGIGPGEWGRRVPVPVAGVSEKTLPEVQWTQVFSREDGGRELVFRFRYPEDYTTGEYVREMARQMNAIRSLPRTPGNGEVLAALADYLRVFAVGLPFERVNFSLAMAQVNYVLLAHGYRGIEHGELDFQAMMFSAESYRAIFADRVARSQDQSKQ